jgi:hypothetical protein
MTETLDLHAPGAAAELALAIWLLVKGFAPAVYGQARVRQDDE